MSISGRDDGLYNSRIREMFGEIEEYYSSGKAAADLARARACEAHARADSGEGEERILAPEEVLQAKRAGATFIALMRRLASSMSPAGRLYYQIGLHASHLDEAMAQGDFGRAEAHYKALIELASRITRTQ